MRRVQRSAGYRHALRRWLVGIVACTGLRIPSLHAQAVRDTAQSVAARATAVRAGYRPGEDDARAWWMPTRLVADVQTFATSLPERPIISNGLGGIAAVLPAFAEYRSARDRMPWSASVFAEGGRSIAWWIAPAVSSRGVFLDRAGLLWRGAIAQGGIVLEPLQWEGDQRRNVGLSDLGPRLGTARVSVVHPVAIRGVSRITGPFTGEIFAARLRGTQRFPGSYLVGWGASAHPSSKLVIGLEVLDEMGGRGAPPATWAERIADLTAVADAFVAKRDWEMSNKMAGLTLRFAVPGLTGVDLYAEQLFDDLDNRRLWRCVTQDGSHLVGMRRMATQPAQGIDALVEWRGTGYRFAEHSQFTTGVVSENVLIGDPLGPHAETLRADLGWKNTASRRIGLTATWATRNGTTYWTEFTGPRYEGFYFRPTHVKPNEIRWTGILSFEAGGGHGVRGTLSAGVERVENFGFQLVPPKTAPLLATRWQWVL